MLSKNLMTVEAVFAGHTHQDHIFYDVTTSNMNEPDDLFEYGIMPTGTAYIYYDSRDADPPNGICSSPVFIETNTACKDY